MKRIFEVKNLVTLVLCLMLGFITLAPVPALACNDLVSSVQPNNPSKYPIITEWEPDFIGHLNAKTKAKKTHSEESNWVTIHTDYLYKINKTKKKNKTVTTYTKYKRTHMDKYRRNFTKGSKKYTKDVRIKVTLSKVGTTSKKPSSPYKCW